MATINTGGTQIALGTNFEVRQPLQSAFLAYVSVTLSNVTGNNTYVIPCDAEVFDQNADYNTVNGLFTAPITGRYKLFGTIMLTGITTVNRAFVRVVTSNRTYTSGSASPVAIKSAAGYAAYSFISLADMDAGDTASLGVTSSGQADNSVDVFGSASCQTCFSGYLKC